MLVQSNPPQQSSNNGPPKRSLFSKPSWSRAESLQPSSLFNRSDQVYVNSAYDTQLEQKRKRIKAEKENLTGDRTEGRTIKRPKIDEDESSSGSGDDDDDDGGDDDVGSTEDAQDETKPKLKNDDHELNEQDEDYGAPMQNTIRADSPKDKARLSTPARRDATSAPTGISENSGAPLRPKEGSSLLNPHEETTTQRNAQKSEIRKAQPSEVIDLDDDDVTGEIAKAPHLSPSETHESIQTTLASELSDADEEFPELAKKARERARLRQEQNTISQLPTLPPAQSFDENHINDPFMRSQSTPPSKDADPVVKILITSSIPNTHSLLVSRRLSQRLKDVRLAWIHKQGLERLVDDIFLTWRGKRLFDVTTCKSLGVGVGGDGLPIPRDIIAESEGNVQVEAVTKEIFEKRKKAQREGSSEDVDGKQMIDLTQSKEDEKVDEKLRIICKAKDFPDYKLAVRPTTLISKMLNAFRNDNGISTDREIFLQFDGERIASTCNIGDTEISDMDHVDLYIK